MFLVAWERFTQRPEVPDGAGREQAHVVEPAGFSTAQRARVKLALQDTFSRRSVPNRRPCSFRNDVGVTLSNLALSNARPHGN